MEPDRCPLEKQMNKTCIVAALSILGLTTAEAADFPVKVPAPVAAAPFSWTGFYVGALAGAGVLHDSGWTPAAQTVSVDRDGIGALAGGQFGYNYQMGMLVLGIEGEGFWSSLSDGANFSQSGTGFAYATGKISNHWDADIAGRFGLAFDRALIFGKAGWVTGGFNWNYTQAFNSFGSPPAPLTTPYMETANATLNGLLIGVGLEYAFASHWSTKFEYDYLGFQNQDVLFTRSGSGSGTPPFNTYKQTVSTNKNIFKIGVNYLFN
jgi:outer membrane immunogenic protein